MTQKYLCYIHNEDSQYCFISSEISWSDHTFFIRDEEHLKQTLINLIEKNRSVVISSGKNKRDWPKSISKHFLKTEEFIILNKSFLSFFKKTKLLGIDFESLFKSLP